MLPYKLSCNFEKSALCNSDLPIQEQPGQLMGVKLICLWCLQFYSFQSRISYRIAFYVIYNVF